MRASTAAGTCGLLLVSGLGFTSHAAYRHPGIFNSQEELDFIRDKATGSASHPMKQGLERLKSFSGASLTYQNRPEATVEVLASAVGASEQNFRTASHAAYAHALQWVVTGDVRHRDKGLEIINGWAAVFKGMTRLSNHQEDLEAAWALPTWAAAGEIFRYYKGGAAGWDPGDIARFNAMLNVLAGYALYTMEPRKMTNNWGTSSALALMAAGVFQDDSVKFNKGMAYLEFLLPYTVEKTGLLMETCRDCNHAEYNLLGMMPAAEIAWKQGIDFYGRRLDGQTTPRLLMGMEFHASALLGKPLNVGQSCGPRSCSGEDKHASGWEMGLNHYRYRMNVPAPATVPFVTTQNRPDGLSEDHFTGWTTLTHGELGNILNPLALDPAGSAGPGHREGRWILEREGGTLALRRFRSAGSRMEGPSEAATWSALGRASDFPALPPED